jgi:anti-sigma regulatory factor (Ser/Thr protein kinase)
MAEEYSITIKNKIDELRKLYELLDQIQAEWQIGQDIAFNVNLVFDELVSNAIYYSFDDGEEHDIEVILGNHDGKIVITIIYGGKEFNPLDAPEPDIDSSVEDRKIGGLGIYLVRNLMDSMEYKRENNQNIIVISKNI